MIKMRRRQAGVLAMMMGFLLGSGMFAGASELLVKSSEKIAFLGDSITQGGNRKNGYITFVMDALNREGLKLTHVPAGIGGHKSSNMLARLDRDVLSKKPDWMLLSCGVNDAWHFTLTRGKRKFQGVGLDDYKKNIRAIVDQTEKAGVKVMILTATMIGEDPEKATNKRLEPYNVFLRELAKEKKLPLADLDKEMRAALAKIPDEKGKAHMFGEPKYDRMIKNKLTTDGCHMNTLGNIMMARGILKTFGLPEEKIAAAEKDWLKK